MSESMLTPMYTGRRGPWADDARIESLNASNWGAQIVSQFGGGFMEMARRGLVFAARSGAAAAIPVNTTLTNAPTLWNPVGSGKVLVPLKIMLSAATLGTQVIDGFTINAAASMGNAAGAGQPFPTFTNIAPVSTRIGAATVAQGKFANAVVTWTAQPSVLFDIGIGQWVSGTAATGQPYNNHVFDFDGSVIMAPGTAICLGAATAASSGTYWTTILYAELPEIVLS